jgi:hypothetical protein
MNNTDYRLTCGQRFFAHRLETWPRSSLPNQRVYRFSDSFNYALFKEAFRYVIGNHPGLRLRIFREKEEWRQFFPSGAGAVDGVVVNGSDPQACHTEAMRMIAEHKAKTIDVKFQDPVKAKVIKVNQEYLLSICIDHIAADETTFLLLEKALIQAYQTLLSDGTLHQVDSTALKQYLSAEESKKKKEEANLTFWKEMLWDAPSIVTPSKGSMLPAEKHVYTLEGDAFLHLRETCRIHQCSLFNILTAIQATVMMESGGVNDVVITMVISNRFTPEEQDLLLNMVMLLPVRFRTPVLENPSAFLEGVRDQTLEAFMHRHYDYPSLYRILDAEARKRGTHPRLPVECNLIVDEDPVNFPNRLFKSRRPDEINKETQTTSGGFLVYGFQAKNSVKAHFIWDKETWKISSEEMGTYIPELIKRFIER